ncbi:hypothetical protein ACKKBG_A26295 [Auxenochlorella protothecoides x Auxenochlorella symbiontica]
MATETTPQNAWVESYLNALLTYGLSSEYAGETKTAQSKKAPESDRSTYNRFYVQSLLNLNEEALSAAWLKAASVTKHGNDKDARLQYLSWRIWFMKKKHATVVRSRPQEVVEEDSGIHSPEELSEDEGSAAGAGAAGAPGGEPRAGRPARRSASSAKLSSAVPSPSPEPRPLPSQTGWQAEGGSGADLKVKVGRRPGVHFDTAFEEFHAAPSPLQSSTPPFGPDSGGVYDKLYIILISLHGLVRGEHMELGRDSDTGGQVKYVVELTKAMALHPAVHRVELLTRQITDPGVDASYGVEEECLARGAGDTGGAFIVRLPCGPPDEYVRKELLWPHVREFADRGIAHAGRQLARMAEGGRRCELYAVHGHYADAGEVAVLMASSLDAHMVMTGHSLGRNKLEHLLKGGAMTRREIEEAYAIGRRIEAEERALDTALMVFTSTQQEIDEQWGLYDGYSPGLARVLHFRRSYGRHMPLLKVSPPGLDFSNLKVTIPADPVVKEFEAARAAFAERELAPAAPAAQTQASGDAVAGGGTPPPSPAAQTPRVPDTLDPRVALIPEGPRIWQDIARFLRNPLKPAILAMSRPDPKKNLVTLVRAFGESPMLRELSNLVLIMGNRDDIESMSTGTQKVLVQVLKLIDKYDLHGSVAYPKHHTQADISDIYKFATSTRGVFTNIALQEPFGLTVIEAAAHGAPTVATANGGPVDIMATLHHGVTVDPTDTQAVIAALLKILTNSQTWDEMSKAGVNNIMAYSWPSHVKRYVEALDAEVRFIKSYKRHDRTMSGLLDSRVALKSALEDNDAHVKKQETTAMDRHFSLPQPSRSSKLHGHGPSNLQPIRRNISGISTDDMALLQSHGAEAPKPNKSPAGIERDHLVFFSLDHEACVGDVAAAILSLQKKVEAAGASVGAGVLSMMGFETSKALLQREGVDLESIDFMVCNSGADTWHRADNGEWDADEGYQSLIEFEWDRTSLYRTLRKIVSRPAPGDNSKALPRLKELLYNVVEAPEVGVHPRHFCIELDPETQSILAVGMGPRAKDTKGVALAATVTDRLKRRLRSKGFRASYTLQMIPRGSSHTAALHITPVRASRALALRFLARLWGNDLESVTVVALVPSTRGEEAKAMTVSSHTNDLADLLAGMQRAVVVPVESKDKLPQDELLDQFGVDLQPWASYGDRVSVQAPDSFADTLLAKLAK